MPVKTAAHSVEKVPYVIALGGAIRWLREQREMSQAELAARAGMTQPRLSRFERGESQPDAYALRRLAVALGITLEDLNARVDDALRRAERATTSTLRHPPASAESWWEGATAVAGFVGLVALIGFAVAAVFGEGGAPKK
jgi:transcriptional regulator with XRE-family HTH domain